jgi:hypothetical protein
VVKVQLSGKKIEKLTAVDAVRVFDTIVAIGGRGGGTRVDDDGGDPEISSALLRDALPTAGAVRTGVYGRDMYLQRNSEDSRTLGRPVTENGR